MQRRHHQHAVFFKEQAVLARDAKVRLDDPHRGDPAQTDDDLGAQQLDLVAQPADAQLLLLGLGVAVVRRTALDDIGDIDILFSVQIHRQQHFVEQHTGSAHKRLALQVLVFAGTLADKHHLGVRHADAHHHMKARLAERAFAAGKTGSVEFFPSLIHFVTPFIKIRLKKKQIRCKIK